MVRRRDPLTPDLFDDWEPPKVAVGYSTEVMGRGGLDNKIARLIAQALRDARDEGRSRSQIAKAMSDYLGRAISEAMLNKWSSEASGEHRIPLDAFIALVHATGAMDLLGFAPGEFGMTVISSKYANLIRLHLIRERKQQLDAWEQAILMEERTKR